MDNPTIFALFKSKIDNQTRRGHQKRPSAVRKGREGGHGRLIHAADIKNGLEDGRGLLQGHEGRSGHLVCGAAI